MTKLHLIEGSNAKMHITIVLSSSSYPKNIYGMPCLKNMEKIQFEFEFKFKLNLNRKRKTQKEKEKEKGGSPDPDGLAAGGGPAPLLWPKWPEPTRL